ncbi:hypothetical protein [Halomonas saccharevitans]|uniref:hypothetical protein n=1 Tax=Halomonas saccharevitans TaxID=416872 RepID=UPI000B7EC3CC|nr:hypothetical protein [Halomonas saccharevitans]
MTDVGTAVQESAERLSVGTTWLQEWQAVGRRFGVQNDALVDGIKELSLRADEFVMTAGGPAAEAFGRLGIGAEDLRKTGGDTAAMFDLVRSRLGRLENDAARQRVFDEIFGGQGGEQMVAMLGATREEVEGIMRAARERGEILSPEEIENSREYNREMGSLRQSLFGIQRTVVGELLPAITDWIERMRELATTNREAISGRVLEGLRSFWAGLQQVGRVVSWLADEVGGFGNLALWMAGIMSVTLIGSLASAGLAIINFGVTLAATPVGWFVAAVAGIAAAAYLIYRNWDGISAWFDKLWEGIKAAAVWAWDGLKTLFGWTPLGMVINNWGGIVDWFAGMWDGVTAWFDQGIGGIVQDLLAFSPAGLLLQGIDAVFELFGARPLTEVGREWIGGLWSGITERWTALTGWLSQKIEELTGWLPDWAQERLGLGEMGAPQASGAPVAEGRSGAMPGPGRTEVGGELRIVVDSEGRPRVAEARRDGALDFDVTSGALGVMP